MKGLSFAEHGTRAGVLLSLRQPGSPRASSGGRSPSASSPSLESVPLPSSVPFGRWLVRRRAGLAAGRSELGSTEVPSCPRLPRSDSPHFFGFCLITVWFRLQLPDNCNASQAPPGHLSVCVSCSLPATPLASPIKGFLEWVLSTRRVVPKKRFLGGLCQGCGCDSKEEPSSFPPFPSRLGIEQHASASPGYL